MFCRNQWLVGKADQESVRNRSEGSRCLRERRAHPVAIVLVDQEEVAVAGCVDGGMIVTGREDNCVDGRAPRIIDRPPYPRGLPERGKLLGGAKAAALAGSQYDRDESR